MQCRGDPCRCGSQDKHVLEACWKMARSCVFQGLSFAWRSLQAEQRPDSQCTRHSLGPGAVRIALWGLEMPGVCPSWQPEAVQVCVLLSPQWEAVGTLLRLHIAQDLLTQQPEAAKFRQEHRFSCNKPSDLVTHSLPKQPLLM